MCPMLEVPKMIPDRVAAHAWSLVLMGEPDECWIWPRRPGSHGYGQIGWWADGRSHGTTVHRAIWQHLHGPVPAGMTIDHRCRTKLCVNPMHLRLLTNLENATDNGMWGHA